MFLAGKIQCSFLDMSCIHVSSREHRKWVHMPAHIGATIILALDGILSLCETAEWLDGLLNATRASFDTVGSRKFGMNYPNWTSNSGKRSSEDNRLPLDPQKTLAVMCQFHPCCLAFLNYYHSKEMCYCKLVQQVLLWCWSPASRWPQQTQQTGWRL